MKTMIVLSDSHNRAKKELEKLQPLFAENDYIVHLGDGSADLRETFRTYPEKTFICKGNCDFSYGAEEFVIEEEGLRILCCHGHRYSVKSGTERLAAYAREKGCDVALYGHTHIAAAEEVKGVLCINPGALGNFTEPSYCYLVLDRGKATHVIVKL